MEGRGREGVLRQEQYRGSALCEKTLKKWNLKFASPSGDYLTFLCLLLSYLIVNPLILQNTF